MLSGIRLKFLSNAPHSRAAHTQQKVTQPPHPFAYFHVMFFIAYHPVAVPRQYIKDRGWSLSYLGPVKWVYRFLDNSADGPAIRACAVLALLKGYDHFTWDQDMCFSSHAIPVNVDKLDDKDYYWHPQRIEREFAVPRFIKGMRK